MQTSRPVLTLQLHQWTRSKELVRLKRGLYAFPDSVTDPITVAQRLYPPSYVSLEYALHFYGLIPDVPFAITLVTPRVTRSFTTPVGTFYFHTVQQKLFWGYDPKTGMGEKEKVLADYCYLYRHRLFPTPAFWENLRLQNLDQIDFKRAQKYAKRYPFDKVLTLIQSIESFEKKHGSA